VTGFPIPSVVLETPFAGALVSDIYI